jgi:hypothetical protein
MRLRRTMSAGRCRGIRKAASPWRNRMRARRADRPARRPPHAVPPDASQRAGQRECAPLARHKGAAHPDDFEAPGAGVSFARHAAREDVRGRQVSGVFCVMGGDGRRPVNPGLLPRPGFSRRNRQVPEPGTRPTWPCQTARRGVSRFAGQAGSEAQHYAQTTPKPGKQGPCRTQPHPPCRFSADVAYPASPPTPASTTRSLRPF